MRPRHETGTFFEVRVAPRQGPRDLKYDVNVSPVSDSSSGSILKISIESLVTSSGVLNALVLNKLSQRITLHVQAHGCSEVVKRSSTHKNISIQSW